MNDFGARQVAPGTWEVNAPAKVNLWLKIHRKRADGYHDLSTVMLALDLQDSLRGEAASADTIELRVEGPAATGDIPADERNLVWKALQSLREHVGQERGEPAPGFKVLLHKRIPSQAGMGGGSSDAAAALALGERLLDFRADEEWKRALMGNLGADCSFFQEVGTSGLALCEGIGEAVQPWNGPPLSWPILYCVPQVSCPTGPVFGALPDAPRVAGDFPCASASQLNSIPLSDLHSALATDLEPAALAAVPELRVWRQHLDDHGFRHLRLSGSGSAFFGLYGSDGEARAAQQELETRLAAKGLEIRAIGVARALAR